MLEIFDYDDSPYLAWLAAHPDGYVLNRRRGESSDYLVLHRSTCHSIAAYHSDARPDAFTGRGYIKICAMNPEDLQNYIRSNVEFTDGSFSAECSHCRPLAVEHAASAPANIEDRSTSLDHATREERSRLMPTIRKLLHSFPSGLTPQEIRDIIKDQHPSLCGTDSHRRNVSKGHYKDIEHALLAQIYLAGRQASDICVDRSVKPMRFRLAKPSTSGMTPLEGSAYIVSNSKTKDAADNSVPRAGSQPAFDLEHARNGVVRICFQIWRATQEGEVPRNISAIINQLKASKSVPVVTASLMFSVCAIRNAAVYSDWQPSPSELEVAKHASAAIDAWWKTQLSDEKATMEQRIAKLTTPEACERFIKNAIRLNELQLADQALRRAVELRAASHGTTTEVERECLQAIYAYEEILSRKNGKRTRASRTWQMVERHGILAAAERAVDRSTETAGYRALTEMGLQQYAFEAVILRHPQLFSADAVARSLARMKE